jgi:hypothetical protein
MYVLEQLCYLFKYVFFCVTQKGKTATNAIFEVLAPSLQNCVHQFDHTKGWLGQKTQEPVTKIVGNLHACVLDLSLTHVHEAGKSLL